MSIIHAENLTKKFNDLVAVDHISLDVQEGEVFGFLGPNGAGKTTTIKMLTTLLAPSDGGATIAGHDVVREANRVRGLIGLVPQELTVDDELTGWENILLQAALYHLPVDTARRRAAELLGLVGLTEAAPRRVRTYSGGMRKRLELAEGLIHRPKVLFLDEPSLGLDVQTRAVIWDYIRGLNQEGITLFLTTHYMDEADALCHRVAIIDHGKIIASGVPSELKNLVGGDVVEIVLAKGQTDLKSALGDLPQVVDVKSEGEKHRVKVSLGEEAIPRIFERLNQAGIRVESVSLTKPTLDQVYLEFTGRSLRDEEQPREDRWTTFTRRRRM